MFKKFGIAAILGVAAMLVTSQAKGPLSSNLKLSSQKQQSISATNVEQIDAKNSLGSKDILGRLEQDEPIFINYKRPFTASPYYDFFDSFLLGLKLETFFKGSDACIMDVVYAVDDLTYLQNNITDFKWASWEAPVMNLTKLISGNLSSAMVDCETMGENAYAYAIQKYAQFGYNIGDFLLSFLFNLMGSALKFKSIFDEINDDMKNQNYADIANQYGRMIRIVFDFEPLAESSLSAAAAGISYLIGSQDNMTDQEKAAAAIFNDLSHDLLAAHEEGASHDNTNSKAIAALEKTVQAVESYINEYSLPNFQHASEVFNSIMAWGAATWNLPTFTPSTDTTALLWGMVEGGVQVLPTDSMIAFCQGNSTLLYPTAIDIYNKFAALLINDGLKKVQLFTKYTQGTIFNCFYTVTNPVQAAQYSKQFTLSTVLFNILFNLGYMYTNGKFVYSFFYYDTGAVPASHTWANLGKNLGSFFVRFIYSKYANKSYYNFGF